MFARNSRSILSLALEDINQVEQSSTADQQKEQEITIYAKVGKPENLQQAFAKEHHVQAEIKVDEYRRIRVRKTTRDSQPAVYELTSKVLCSNKEGVRSFIETTKAIDPDVFEMFLSIVPSFQAKTRYFFKIEKLTVNSGEGEKNLDLSDFKYEVDVYTDKEGKESQWCKIDLEIQGLEDKLKEAGVNTQEFNVNVTASSLPFEPSEFIVMSDETSQADKDKISNLYETEFLTFNSLPGQEIEETEKEEQVETVSELETGGEDEANVDETNSTTEATKKEAAETV